jgi:hypothetical protein
MAVMVMAVMVVALMVMVLFRLGRRFGVGLGEDRALSLFIRFQVALLIFFARSTGASAVPPRL